jgi:multicomponent Na+:H+ antiporter subunit B
MAGMSVIVRTIARLLFPFMFLFGAYVVAHGHLTPGGGFPGGVIIAASVVMLILAYGTEWIQKRVGLNHAKAMESAGLVAIFVMGLLGLLLGSFFLQNVLPAGELGELFSGGDLPLLYLAVGIEVAAGIFLIFYAMLFKSRGEEE